MILSKKYVNTTCQIHSPNNMLIGFGKISEAEDTHVLIINKSDDFPDLEFLSFIKVTFSSAVAGYKVILANVGESTQRSIRLVNMTLLTNDEKRDYFRVHVAIPTKVFLSVSVAPVEKQCANTKIDIKQPMIPFIEVIIKDIGLGGVCIAADAYLQLGQKIIIVIVTSKCTQYIPMVVKRRTFDELLDNYPYYYGCTFVEKDNKKLDELCRHVLALQAKMIQQIKNS